MIFEIRSTYTAMNKWAASWQNQQNDLCAQRRLRCPVWSESLQCAQWEARLIGVFAGRKGHFVGFVKRRLKCERDNKKLILENQHRISIWVEEGCAGGGGWGVWCKSELNQTSLAVSLTWILWSSSFSFECYIDPISWRNLLTFLDYLVKGW